MAILDRPLFSDEAKGKIRNTVTFFKRGEWYHLLSVLSFKDRDTAARLAQKTKYHDGVAAWRALSPSARVPYQQGATWNLSAYNYFLSRFLLGLPPLTALNPSDTVQNETTWGITPNAGTSLDYSRGDHTHGTPATPAAGEGHITILPFNYLAIVQGTWIFATSASNWSAFSYYNSSNAQNDQINYALSLAPGTYKLILLAFKTNTCAIATISLDGVPIGTIDTYAAAPTYNAILTISGITVTAGGLKTLALKAATRNASSTGWYLSLNAITLFRTA